MARYLVVAQWSWELDGWIVAAGILCAVASSLLGNFLVLRRMSMLGDAISHAVLPGLAAAFLVTASRATAPMFVGAVVVGVLTAFFSEWIRRVGRVDEGASMGVVFTSLFALGLVMIVRAADHVPDLDPGCVLYGAIELTPFDLVTVGEFEVPRAVLTLGVVAVINLAFVVLCFKELKISSFDPALSTASGFDSRLMHYSLMVLVAVTAVASFESVGNILVVAMFVVPPAAAWLFTERLAPMVALSSLFAAMSAVGGHLAAINVPGWFGFQSTTTASMMAVIAGGLLLIAILFAPRQGIVGKFFRQRWLAFGILADDVIALLYRWREKGATQVGNFANLKRTLFSGWFSLGATMAWLWLRGKIRSEGDAWRLTPQGVASAANLVRSHRLWEQYLVTRAGYESDRIHDKAERFEHFTDPSLRERLDQVTDAPSIDPHGAPIPEEGGGQ